MHLEFEQKFVLHPDAIDVLRDHAEANPDHCQIEHIWQCYGAKKQDRFRLAIDDFDNTTSCVYERKSGVDAKMPYSIQLESPETPIAQPHFLSMFDAAQRRLAKLRWTFDAFRDEEDFSGSHRLMVDLFIAANPEDVGSRLTALKSYLLMAETETILDVNKRQLDLDFRLPRFLRPYCLMTIDKRDRNSSQFSSYNLHMTPEVMNEVQERVRKLCNEQTQQL